MESVRNRLVFFAICPLVVKGVALNVWPRIKSELVKDRVVQFHQESTTDKDGMHGCTLYVHRSPNSNDSYQ